MADPMDTPAAVEGGILTLSEEDLKQIRNGVISALTHSDDVRAFLDQRIAAALDAAGVITNGNIHESDGLYDRFKETTYEQVWKVVEEAGLAHKPPKARS